MKKIIALLMAVLMTVGMLAACSSTPAETNPPAADERLRGPSGFSDHSIGISVAMRDRLKSPKPAAKRKRLR